MTRVGIVIVTWNSAAVVGSCLDAALPRADELVVIDNASTDDTCEQVRRRGARLIANTENRGFAAAANQGFRALSAEAVLLLNPDVVLTTPLDAMLEACSRQGAAGAGGLLVDCSGRPQRGFAVRRIATPLALSFEALLLNRLWPSNRVNWQYRCLNFDFTMPQTVEQPAGALLMVRRDVWEQLGGFDEGFYPLWFEDVDLCKRALDRGFSWHYVPAVVAHHTGGHSIPKIPLEKRAFYWYGSLLRYTARHFPVWSVRMVSLSVLIGSLMRMVMGIPRARSLKPLAAWFQVMRLAGRYFLSSPGRACSNFSVD